MTRFATAIIGHRRQLRTPWSAEVRRVGFLVQSGLGHSIHISDLRLFACKIPWSRKFACHGRAGSSPSRTRTLLGMMRCRGTILTALLWPASLVQHVVVTASIAGGLASPTLLIYFGMVLAAQHQILMIRARSQGLPARPA